MIKTFPIKDAFYLINKYSHAFSQAECEMLLTYILNCGRLDIYTKDIVIDTPTEDRFDALIQQRLDGVPIQYITGQSQFMGYNFIVDKNVLIPRPETEILVSQTLNSAFRSPHHTLILDLCTGSGNIAVSLAKLLPQAEIIAADISPSALKTAEINAKHNNVHDKISFYEGDMFKALPHESVAKKYKFDIMVCNPPYIKSDDLAFLQKEVQSEPKIALDGGKDGLEFYRHIAENAGNYLKSKGDIFLEIGYGQTSDIISIFQKQKRFNINNIVKDFNGIERVIWISLL